MPPTSPTVARLELTHRIRQRREHLELDSATVATAVGIAASNWSHIEAGRRILQEPKLRVLLDLLEFDEVERGELLALRELSKQRGWWDAHATLLGGELLQFHGLEYGASTERTHDSVLIPGLLQTADYARALIANDTTFIPKSQVKQRLEIRLRRQQRLREPDPLHITAVLGEAALHQKIGGVDVLRGQLDHLIDLLETVPTVDLHVITFDATKGIHTGATFYLLDFESRVWPPTVAWYEGPGIQGLIDDPADVQALELTHELAQDSALSRDDSLEMMRHCRRQIG
ncbi:helix-turn-helix domain-containing protein [Nocardia uniformis]|uniref:Helix-turn-helix domain-containing protein n=1 Tax=Nocardia uniformis TaxID=53432 RepID=A0A849CFN7_9NOCA|nr:helix-turn-helix transcriptional regulator [Nocardia uniformis]NNH75660.1 helix-turn-helix domain-containing protein [Nocardia uniformis]